ncbi:MAG: Proprotein convertase [Proteobacteria bacterium]|nr:Proprotein convertase [Pseudomonadota bacterium]
MATFTAYTAFNYTNLVSYASADSGYLKSYSASKCVFVMPAPNPDATVSLMSASSNFKASSSSGIYSGTLTSVTAALGTVKWFTTTNLSYSMANNYWDNGYVIASGAPKLYKFEAEMAVWFKGNDTFYGSAYADRMNGYGGNDLLDGKVGNDTLLGSYGNDTIKGGAGNDSMDGGVGTDTLSYEGVTAGVKVSLATTSAQNTVGAGSDTVKNFENLTGSSYNDTLTGGPGANSINGGSGNDTIGGGAGNDTLDGGLGTDTVAYAYAGTGVTVFLATTGAQNTVGAGMDVVKNFENLIGSSYNDTLVGSVVDNVITGSAGADSVTGGAGNDTFVFAVGASGLPSASNFDVIADFGTGSDVIDFGATALVADVGAGTGLTVVAGLVTAGVADLGAFITELGNSTTSTAGSTLIYDDGVDSYLFISDGLAGLGANDVLVQLVGVTGLTAGATFAGGDIVAVA